MFAVNLALLCAPNLLGRQLAFWTTALGDTYRLCVQRWVPRYPLLIGSILPDSPIRSTLLIKIHDQNPWNKAC